MRTQFEFWTISQTEFLLEMVDRFNLRNRFEIGYRYMRTSKAHDKTLN